MQRLASGTGRVDRQRRRSGAPRSAGADGCRSRRRSRRRSRSAGPPARVAPSFSPGAYAVPATHLPRLSLRVGEVVVEVDVLVGRAALAVEVEHAAGRAPSVVQNLILPASAATAICALLGHQVVARVRPLGARLAEVVAVGDRADDREDEPRHGAVGRSPSRPRRKSLPKRGWRRIRRRGLSTGGGSHARVRASEALTLPAFPAGRHTRSDRFRAVKIAVCVKQVPEAAAAKRIDPGTSGSTAAARPGSTPSTRTRSRRPCGSRRRTRRRRGRARLDGPGAGARGAAQGAGDGRRPRAARHRRRGRRLRSRRHELRARGGARARTARPRPLRPAGVRLRRRRALGRRRRAPAAAARLAGGRARARRRQGAREAADRVRLRPDRGAAPGGRRRLGRDQRAALPVAEGDHGREVEAAGDALARRSRARRRARGRGRLADGGATPSAAAALARRRRCSIEDDGSAAQKIVDFLAERKLV